jgi:hypothetical protein
LRFIYSINGDFSHKKFKLLCRGCVVVSAVGNSKRVWNNDFFGSIKKKPFQKNERFFKFRANKNYLITNLWFSIKLSDSNLTINSEDKLFNGIWVSFAFKLKCCTILWNLFL